MAGICGLEEGNGGVEGDAADAELFLAGRLTGGEGDGVLGKVEVVGEEADQLGVGFVVHGRGGELELEAIAVEADELAARGAGLNVDEEEEVLALGTQVGRRGHPRGFRYAG